MEIVQFYTNKQLHLYFIPSTSICNLPFVGKLREN